MLDYLDTVSTRWPDQEATSRVILRLIILQRVRMLYAKLEYILLVLGGHEIDFIKKLEGYVRG
jgi:hypothetical protein